MGFSRIPIRWDQDSQIFELFNPLNWSSIHHDFWSLWNLLRSLFRLYDTDPCGWIKMWLCWAIRKSIELDHPFQPRCKDSPYSSLWSCNRHGTLPFGPLQMTAIKSMRGFLQRDPTIIGTPIGLHRTIFIQLVTYCSDALSQHRVSMPAMPWGFPAANSCRYYWVAWLLGFSFQVPDKYSAFLSEGVFSSCLTTYRTIPPFVAEGVACNRRGVHGWS